MQRDIKLDRYQPCSLTGSLHLRVGEMDLNIEQDVIKLHQTA